MKKLLLTIALVSLVGFASAQDYTKQEVRQTLRKERLAANGAAIAAAIKAQNFTFGASYMTPLYNSPQVALNSFTNIVAIYPGYLEVNLPYQTVAPYDSEIGNQITINTNAIKNYQVQTSPKGNLTITFNTTWDGVNYSFHMRYMPSNGNANLTVIPNWGDPITYSGTIQAN